MENISHFKKSDIEIIDKLILDTQRGKIFWYHKNDDVIFSKLHIIHNGNIITLTFELSDIDSDFDEYTEYSFQLDKLVILDIFLSKKNIKKRIFCKRISSCQMKLFDLIVEVMNVVKKLNIENG